MDIKTDEMYLQTDRQTKQLLLNGDAQNLSKKVGCQCRRNHDGSEDDPPNDQDIKTQIQTKDKQKEK